MYAVRQMCEQRSHGIVFLRASHAIADVALDQLPWHVCNAALRCEECRAISLLLGEVGAILKETASLRHLIAWRR